MLGSIGAHIQIRGEEVRPALQQHDRVVVFDPGPTAVHHDVLSRLRHHSLRQGFDRAVWQNVNNQSVN